MDKQYKNGDISGPVFIFCLLIIKKQYAPFLTDCPYAI